MYQDKCKCTWVFAEVRFGYLQNARIFIRNVVGNNTKKWMKLRKTSKEFDML